MKKGILIAVFVAVIVGCIYLVFRTMSTTRIRAGNEVILMDMATLQTIASKFHDTNRSYKGVCTDPKFVAELEHAATVQCTVYYDGSCPTPPNPALRVCNGSATAWAASMPLLEGNFACVDNIASASVLPVGLTQETACASVKFGTE
jgi:hypothetical protein